MGIEFGILDFIQTMRTPLLDSFMILITKLGNGGFVWIVLCIFMIIFPKTRKTGIAMAISLLIEVLMCNVIIKPLVARARPFVLKPMDILIQKPSDYSFPSGHAGASFASSMTLFFARDKLFIPSFILAILISFSRLYLYVHYPSDVVVGAMLGVISAFIGTKIMDLIARHIK